MDIVVKLQMNKLFTIQQDLVCQLQSLRQTNGEVVSFLYTKSRREPGTVGY